MTENHDQFRDWAAAYVLGALDPVERIDYERHLRSCAQCQTDVGEFAALPGLLAQVGPPGEPEDAAATGTIAIDGRLWGTNIEVNLTGLPQRDVYQLWAVDESGTWIVAATWTSTPGGRAKVTGAAAVDVGAVTQVIITSTDREDVLVDGGP